MMWNTRYLPPDPTQWQGRDDIPPDSCFFQSIQMLNLLQDTLKKSDKLTFALVGFRCEEGILRSHGRVGAKEGPNAVRQALATLPIQKQNFICYDTGNITCADGDLESSQQALGEVVELLLQHDIKTILIGGGHELAWGHYQGIAKTFPKKHLGIINFDSHFDMSPLQPGHKGTSGTAFLQIAKAHERDKRRFDYNCVGIQHSGNIRQLFETAKKYQTKMILADEFYQGQVEKCIDFVDRVIDENDLIYVSLCLDVFAAAFSPGVSATQPLGLNPWHVIPLIRQLALSGKVVSYDIVDLSPRYDIDHCTAKLAANLVYEIVHHHTLQLRPW